MPEALPDLFHADGVLFDLDGVLTPTAEVHMRAWKAVFDDVFARWGITAPYTDADYYDYVDGKKRYDGVASLMRSRNVELPWGDVDDDPTAETVCGIGNRKNAAFAASLRAQGIAPYPGSLALVESLHVVASRSAWCRAPRTPKRCWGPRACAPSSGSWSTASSPERDGLASKPAADMFAAGAAALGVDPARAVAVEDATSGAASAAAAGFATVVGVDRGAGADALRAAGATVVVDDLDVFPSASRNDIPETA